MAGILATLLLLVMFAPAALADSVLPSEKVRSRVMLREKATRHSRAIGSLRPGERAEHLASEQGWHRVRLANGKTGFVSAAWTQVIVDIPEDPVDLEEIAKPRRSFFGAIGGFFRGLFRSEQPIEFEIRDPDLRASVYRHTDPNLPVSGIARSPGAGRFYDLVLAIDSGSGTTYRGLRSTGAAFSAVTLHDASMDFDRVRLATSDVNRDGRGDVVVYARMPAGEPGTRLYVYRSTGSALGPAELWLEDAGLDWQSVEPY